MAKKEQTVIYLRDGGKLFADQILRDNERGIVFVKESKTGRKCEVSVPSQSVAYVEVWKDED